VREAIVGFVRLGYVAKAVVYLLIGTLALRVAIGLRGGRLTDPGGALYVVLQRPMGHTLLLAIAVGLLAYAAWQVAAALLGRDRHARAGYLARALTIVRAAVYGLIGVQAMRLALGLRGGHTGPAPLVREALHWPFGEWLVILAGVGSALYVLFEIRDAINGHLEPDLDASTLRRGAGEWALQVARAGIVARALVLVLLAVGVIRAGLAHRASDAGGMDASLTVLHSLPQGAFLLGAAAAGLFAYGVYQLLHARYARL
jgi:uncharacterized protein DUF1206